MNRSYKVTELQDLSDLHVLAISQASLDLVRFAYDKNPHALTDELLLEAFLCGGRPEVLRFLTQKKGCTYKETGNFIGKTFLAAIPLLESDRNTGEIVLHLTELVKEFPKYLVNQFDDSFCALSIVLFSTSFPRNMLDSMTRALPHNEPSFILFDDESLPLDDEHFGRGMRDSLDNERCLKAIGDILEKVRMFHFCRESLTAQELSKILPMVFRKINSITRLRLDLAQGDPPAEEAPAERWRDTMIEAANGELEKSKGGCPIEEISLVYCAHDEWEMPAQPDFSIHTLLYRLKHLRCLNIIIHQPWKATQEVCTTLCNLLKNGSLDTITVSAETETQGLLLPLLDAAASSETLTHLRLQHLGNSEEVEIYQDKMLEILKTNTNLEEALFSEQLVTVGELSDKNDDAIKAHVNKEWFLDGTKGNDKQRHIDYCTLLNYCYRGVAKHDCTTLKQFIGFCLNTNFLRRRLAFLDFKGKDEQYLVTMMQHGLLSEKPSLWAPSGGREAMSSPQIGMRNNPRKRKASEPLFDESSWGSKETL